MKILKPSIRRLEVQPSTMSSTVEPILNFDLMIRTLKTDRICLSLALPTLMKWLNLCRLIIDQSRKAPSCSPSSRTRSPNGVKHLLNQRRLMGRCASKLNPERYPLTICHHHKLCSLPLVSVFSTLSSLFLRMKMFRPRRPSPIGAALWYLRL
jgi:hypothetical protein